MRLQHHLPFNTYIPCIASHQALVWFCPLWLSVTNSTSNPMCRKRAQFCLFTSIKMSVTISSQRVHAVTSFSAGEINIEPNRKISLLWFVY